MYFSGYYLLNGIFMIYFSFKEKRIKYSVPEFPEYINRILENKIFNYFHYCLTAVQFGICVCIFFNLKKSNKSFYFMFLLEYI